MIYFIVSTKLSDASDLASYHKYIEQVKPIVESYGGRYLTRSEQITALGRNWTPERIIIIEFYSRKELDTCFGSKEYLEIVRLREQAVETDAIIVE